MPDHARGNKERDASATTSKSVLSSLVRWLQIKKYQYEVTTSLYMLTSTEKTVFSKWSPLCLLARPGLPLSPSAFHV